MASLTCPHCGSMVEAEQVYCPNCTRSLRLTVIEPVGEVSRPQPTRTVGWIVALGVIGVCALAAIPLLIVPAVSVRGPAGMLSNSPAQKAMCLSNIKQLTTGALIYQSDYDDRNFPTTAFQPVLIPYIKDASIFYCPTTKAPYAVNPAMLKFEVTKVKAPHKTIMFYEGSGKTLSGPHSGSGAVSSTDGSARFIKPSGLSGFVWKPR